MQVVETIYRLPEIMETLGTPTLKAIAMVFDLKPMRLYNVAKTPKEGEIYDAKQYNWEAIERFMNRRLDPDQDLDSLEAVIEAALKCDEELSLSDKRRSGTGYYSKTETIEVDGQTIPVRKFPMHEMPPIPDESGHMPEGFDQSIYPDAHPTGIPIVLIRKEILVYGFIFQTRSHTVLRSVGPDGEFNRDDLKVISNTMLNMKGLPPDKVTKREVTLRYQAQEAEANVAEDELALAEEIAGEASENITPENVTEHLGISADSYYNSQGELEYGEGYADGYFNANGEWFTYA